MSNNRVNMWKQSSHICMLALTAIAAVVATRLIMGRPVWIGITIYWMILTMKNSFDLMIVWRDKH